MSSSTLLVFPLHFGHTRAQLEMTSPETAGDRSAGRGSLGSKVACAPTDGLRHASSRCSARGPLPWLPWRPRRAQRRLLGAFERLSLTRRTQPRLSLGRVIRRQLEADPFPPELLGDDERRAAAAKRVEDNVAGF